MALRLKFVGVVTRLIMLLLWAMMSYFSAPSVADAALILSVQSATGVAGTSGNTFDIDLINTGPTALTIGGFTFGIATANPNISFTDANTATAMPYIFAGDSLLGPDLTGPTSGQSLTASDASLSGLGTTVTAGTTLGLGHILFDVLSSATNGMFPVNLEVSPATSLTDPNGAPVPVDTLVAGEITITGGAAAAVPEPSSMLLFFAGAFLVAGFRLRSLTKLDKLHRV